MSGLLTLEKNKKQPDMIKHYFLKCGLSNNFDGTEDDQMKIKRITNYTMPLQRGSLLSLRMKKKVEMRASLRRLTLIILMIWQNPTLS